MQFRGKLAVDPLAQPKDGGPMKVGRKSPAQPRMRRQGKPELVEGEAERFISGASWKLIERGNRDSIFSCEGQRAWREVADLER